MFNLYNAQFQGLVLHRVGNKNRNEPLQLSASPLRLDDEISGLLKSYFFTPFTQREENYFHFTHEADLEFNPIYNAAKSIFNSPETLQEQSVAIATHLYGQSNHPHINSGELYVAVF